MAAPRPPCPQCQAEATEADNVYRGYGQQSRRARREHQTFVRHFNLVFGTMTRDADGHLTKIFRGTFGMVRAGLKAGQYFVRTLRSAPAALSELHVSFVAAPPQHVLSVTTPLRHVRVPGAPMRATLDIKGLSSLSFCTHSTASQLTEIRDALKFAAVRALSAYVCVAFPLGEENNNNKQSRNLTHTVTTAPSLSSPSLRTLDVQLIQNLARFSRMEHSDNAHDAAHRATCPQELIDLILGNTCSTNKETLKSCALVARSFRPTSQKLIFSALTILPPAQERNRIPTLQRLADVLSTSPHLAPHVRTLHLLKPDKNLSYDASAVLHKPHLASLHIERAPMLFYWMIRAVDPKYLRRLHTEVQDDMNNVIQPLLDRAVYVETYHLSFSSTYRPQETMNLEKMQGLRKLEVSVALEASFPGLHTAFNSEMRTLDTAPHCVEYLVLNLNILKPDELPYFVRIHHWGTSGRTARPCETLLFGSHPDATICQLCNAGFNISGNCSIDSTKERC
ncbi:hypothetical protein GGX14DRAFT_401627 [Mycena pura]|uniref:Uncharacterized protein n=1 Tax=Mycena pura TaxID=153505 RepID=A0AAD6V439_9AGAR|nr:hypothetical protein GGX14DRAFT_401627 [Mycena pura]